MLKRILALALALMAVMAFTACDDAKDALDDLVGGASSTAGSTAKDNEGGLYEGGIGSKMSTYFFDFVVVSAEVVEEYAGHTPSGEDMVLIDVVIATTNTFGEALEMYDTDYQLQWGARGDNDDYSVVLEALDDNAAPLTYALENGETMEFHYVFEAPRSETQFEICYMEEFGTSEDDYEIGDIFYVSFSV